MLPGSFLIPNEGSVGIVQGSVKVEKWSRHPVPLAEEFLGFGYVRDESAGGVHGEVDPNIFPTALGSDEGEKRTNK